MCVDGVCDGLGCFSTQPRNAFGAVDFKLGPDAGHARFGGGFMSIFPSRPGPVFRVFMRLDGKAVGRCRRGLAARLGTKAEAAIGLDVSNMLLRRKSAKRFRVSG